MISRDHIGTISEPRKVKVELAQLQAFARATGEDNPIYFDEAVAKAEGHRSLPAPPTFVFSLTLFAPAERGGIFSLGIDMKQILHAEQSFRHHAPIYAGDTITLVTTTTDIYEKMNGALEFLVQETTATNQDGDLCVEMRAVTAVRHDI